MLHKIHVIATNFSRILKQRLKDIKTVLTTNYYKLNNINVLTSTEIRQIEINTWKYLTV